MIHYLALHYWSKFQKNLTAFGGLWPKKHPEAAKNLKFERHLKTRELHIRHKMKLIYMIKLKYVLTPTPLVYQKMRLSIRGKGGRGEGIPKLLVKVSLKFERSFGYLLPINPEKMCRKWYGNLLIITSPSTSSYYFSPSFFGHWHITLQSHFCRLKNLVRLISLNSTFCNIEIKKNF